jgi:hypothetical protein
MLTALLAIAGSLWIAAGAFADDAPRLEFFTQFLSLPCWSALRQPVTKIRSRYAQSLSAWAGSLR